MNDLGTRLDALADEATTGVRLRPPHHAEPARPRRRVPPPLLVGATAAALALVVGAVAVTRPDDDPGTTVATEASAPAAEPAAGVCRGLASSDPAPDAVRERFLSIPPAETVWREVVDGTDDAVAKMTHVARNRGLVTERFAARIEEPGPPGGAPGLRYEHFVVTGDRARSEERVVTCVRAYQGTIDGTVRTWSDGAVTVVRRGDGRWLVDEWAQERPRPLPDGADRAAFAFPAFDPTCPIVLDDRPRALSLVPGEEVARQAVLGLLSVPDGGYYELLNNAPVDLPGRSFGTAFPPDARLRSLSLDGGVAHLDVNAAAGPGRAVEDCVTEDRRRSLTRTLLGVEGVRGVVATVEGAPWFTAGPAGEPAPAATGSAPSSTSTTASTATPALTVEPATVAWGAKIVVRGENLPPDDQAWLELRRQDGGPVHRLALVGLRNGAPFGLETHLPNVLRGEDGQEAPLTGGTYVVTVDSVPGASASFEVRRAPEEPVGEGEALADGRHFGYVSSVDLAAKPASLSFDLATLLSGDEALHARQEEFGISTSEPLENDYYIRNRSTRLRTLLLAEDATVRTVDWTSTASLLPLVPGDLRGFAAAFNGPVAEETATNYRGSTVPYWLEVRDGRVVAIEEQYVP